MIVDRWFVGMNVIGQCQVVVDILGVLCKQVKFMVFEVGGDGVIVQVWLWKVLDIVVLVVGSVVVQVKEFVCVVQVLDEYVVYVVVVEVGIEFDIVVVEGQYV